MNNLTRLFFAFVVVLFSANAMADEKLSGSVISSKEVKGASNAFDSNLNSYVYTDNETPFEWVGLDLGTPHVITKLGFAPRGDRADRMLLGVIEGANSPDFMDAVPLFLIGKVPESGTVTYTKVEVSRGFRYVRYTTTNKGKCNIAELEVYGHEGEGDDSRFYQVTSLPTVSMHVKDNVNPTQKGYDLESNITITYENGTLIQEYPILTRVRGNFSASWENKPYRIKFNDDKKHHMLKDSEKDESPAKAKKWTLISSYGDKTLMRNPVAYEVSKRIGLPFTPWCKPVDLILNGEYRGTYQLTDHVDVKSDRVNVVEMTSEDIEGEALTGGYMIEMNGYAGSDPVNFTSSHGNPVTIHSPEDDVIQTVQKNYIINHFNEMEKRVFAANYTDPEKGYRSMLDLESFLKYFLSNEFCTNTDYLWQVYMFKERGNDHIFTGPVWDNDLSLENDGNYFPGNQQKDWTYKVRGAGDWRSLVTKVLSDGYAKARLQAIWKELRDQKVFTAQNIADYVDSTRVRMAESARLNHIRWPYLLQQLHCNPKVWGSWDAEVDNVRDFVYGRVEWMDNMLNYGQLKTQNGVYLIESPYDFCVYTDIVRNGDYSASAILTCDIDMADYSKMYHPLGSLEHPYCGTIDGGKHIIKNLVVEGEDNVGLIAVAGERCVVKDLYLDGGCRFFGNNYVGSFAGLVAPSGAVTVENCGTQARVTAVNSAAGGVVGGNNYNSTSVTVKTTYNMGVVEAPVNAGSLVGYAGNRLEVTNSYNGVVMNGMPLANGEKGVYTNCFDVNQNGQSTKVTEDEVRSGKMCYNMNVAIGAIVWRQNIDNGRARDEFPVVLTSHGVVYDLEGRYTNINPNAQGYRYYMLEITEAVGGNCIQVAEFDLLDAALEENPDMVVYLGTDSGIASENWNNMADNNVQTKYCNPHLNGMARLFFDCGITFDAYGYRMFTANDTQSYPVRNPKSWKLYGSSTYSENGSDECWQLIDERFDDDTMGATNFTPYDFIITRAIEEVTLNTTSEKVNPGMEIQLEATIMPKTMEGTPLIWKSTDDEVASVDEEGLVTANAVGEADIVVYAQGFDYLPAKCHVVVTDELLGFQYYMLEVTEINELGVIQFSEFRLLNNDMAPYEELKAYDGPSQFFGNENWATLTDFDVKTKYCGSFNEGTTLYYYFDANSMILPKGYAIFTANDTQKYPGRNPKSWRLWGAASKIESPADSRMRLLDERIGDTTLQATNYTEYDFLIDWETVGIDEVTERGNADGNIYNVAGQRLQNMQRGVNIKDGRKVIR